MNNKEEKPRAKIVVLTTPATGHVNPLLSVFKELVSQRNIQVIVFGTQRYETSIKNTGAEFRVYAGCGEFGLTFVKASRRGFKLNIFLPMRSLMQFIKPAIISTAREIDHEQPDVIVYDAFAIHAKLIIKVLSEKNGTFTPIMTKMPELIAFQTSFATANNIYPNNEQMQLMTTTGRVQTLWHMIKCVFTYYRLCKRYGLRYKKPMETILPMSQQPPTALTIVFVFSEFQPYRIKFDPSVRFVGCTLNEELALNSTDHELQKVIENFPPMNPSEIKSENKLVYVSFGTVFSGLDFLYDTVIEALSSNFAPHCTFIVSVTKLIHKYEQRQLPSNVHLTSYAPQLEILKRASLFVTHSGMNSTMESIYYGVPMVCVPISADQPLVAERVAKDLGLGVQIDLSCISVKRLQQAIIEVLNNDEFAKRVREFSKRSRVHNGCMQAADEIEKFVKKLQMY